MADILLIDIKSGALPPSPDPEPQPQEGYRVRYFDGVNPDPIKIQYVERGNDATPPTNPNPDPTYLVFNSWNNPSTNITNVRDIGAVYDTIDGKSYAFLSVTKHTGKTANIHLMTSNGYFVINWGDGTSDTIDTPVSGIQYKAIKTYTDYGDYVVSIEYVGTSYYTLGWNNGLKMVIGECSTTGDIYQNITGGGLMLKKFYMGRNVSPQFNYFVHLYNLEILTISTDVTSISNLYFLLNVIILIFPNSVTSLGNKVGFVCNVKNTFILPNTIITIGNLFGANSMVQYVIIPDSVTSLGNSFLETCHDLRSTFIGTSVNTIGIYCLRNSYANENFELSSNLTSVGSNFLMNQHYIKKITFGQLVSSIPSNSFGGNTRIEIIKCYASNPPILPSTLFNKLDGYLKIYVPDTAVNTYKNATNWSYYASCIFPLSDIE